MRNDALMRCARMAIMPSSPAGSMSSNEPAANLRPWLSEVSRTRETAIIDSIGGRSSTDIDSSIQHLIGRNREIHESECVNLNPATNVMNPRAEAALAGGLSTRVSLGDPGEKYEMGLEAVEEIEVIAASLARKVFGAPYVEVRVGSGAMANLYAFMATCEPGDPIIVPPAEIGGHVTHHSAGAAGLYRLDIHEGPVDPGRFTYDLDALREQARRVRPKLITIGTSLNLLPHPVAAIREIADEVGAKVLFDSAHACGMFAGRVWPMPLDEGADIVTMSTYKSFGGPPSGLIFSRDEELAHRIDAIAYPGLTANFDAGCTAALAITMLDWIDHGPAYAEEMVSTAAALADELEARGIELFRTDDGPTRSHQFAIDTARWGTGHQAALRLREANILTSEIGLPPGASGSGSPTGVRVGTPEIVRWGMNATHMPELADLIAEALVGDPRLITERATEFRSRFNELHFIRS